MSLEVHAAGDGLARFAIRVKPRSSRPGIGPVRDGALEVRVAAPPVDDAANREVVERIAKALGVPRRDVRIAAGSRGRSKTVEVAGVEPHRIAGLEP